MMPRLLITWKASQPFLLSSAFSCSRPRGSLGSMPRASPLAVLLFREYVPGLTATSLQAEVNGEEDEDWRRAWDRGTMVPSCTHSPSRSVSQSALSLLARFSYRALSFARLRCRSAAQLANRT